MKKLFLALLIVPALAFIPSCSTNTQKQESTPEQTVEMVFMTNIHCDGCVNTVQTKLPDNEGVVKAVANLDTKQVTVTFDSTKIDEAGIITAFGVLGYDASVMDANVAGPEQPMDDTTSMNE